MVVAQDVSDSEMLRNTVHVDVLGTLGRFVVIRK